MNDRYKDVFAALGREIEIVPLDRTSLEIIHDDLIDRYGGMRGIRNPDGLESALARPLQMAAYQDQSSIPELAAAVAHAIIRNHPFVDGNKRTGFAALLTFLDRNGYVFEASPSDALNVIRDCAAGRTEEEDFARWVERNSRPLPPTPARAPQRGPAP